MNNFNFNGNWTFDIELQHLTKLNSDRFYKYRKAHQEKLNQGLVSVRIYDEQTENPDPREEQINCIHWIINNENSILSTIYASVKDKIFKYYINLWQDDSSDEYRYPKLLNIDNLNDAVGLDSIGIHFDFKEDISYYTLFLSFCVDEEHGLAIVLHKDKLIDFGGIGDIDNRQVMEDMGIDYDSWLDQRLCETEKKVPQLYVANEKYKKLKPWQESANNYYPFGLLHADRDGDLLNYLKNNPMILKENLDQLIKVADYKGKINLVNKLRNL